jgi:putative ABC transport system permease protein
MRFTDYFSIALKNLRRQKLRTLLTVLAVLIGSTSIILLFALSEGIKKAINLQLESIGALTTVSIPNPLFAEFQGAPANLNYELDEKLVSKLQSTPHIVAVSPTYNLSDFKYFTLKEDPNSKKVHSSLLTVQANDAGNKSLQTGRGFEQSEKGAIIIGGSYLERLGYQGKASEILGKTAVIYTSSPSTGEMTKYEAKIVGVTKTGPDDAQIYITEDWGKDIAGAERLQNQGYDRVSAKVDSAENVASVVEDLKKEGIYAVSSKNLLDQFFSVFRIVTLILGAIGAIALIVAAIGIINTMIMATYERTKEIGIMRATGASRAVIRRLFMLESALIGLLGGSAGLLAAFALGFIANTVIKGMLERNNLVAGSVISFPVWLIVGTLAFTSLIGLIAGLYPATRAAKLSPIDALRYE